MHRWWHQLALLTSHTIAWSELHNQVGSGAVGAGIIVFCFILFLRTCVCVCVCAPKSWSPLLHCFALKAIGYFRGNASSLSRKKKNERYAAFKKRSRCPLQPSVAHDLHQWPRSVVLQLFEGFTVLKASARMSTFRTLGGHRVGACRYRVYIYWPSGRQRVGVSWPELCCQTHAFFLLCYPPR